MSSARKRVVALMHVCCVLTFIILVPSAFAQSAQDVQGAASFGVARMVEVKAKGVKDGTIITSTTDGPAPSTISYDSHVMGVVSRDAAIILSTSNSTNGVPIIATGRVYILVSSQGGPIKKGDLLTTSTIPGVAVKAVKDGYVLGSALEDFNNTNPKQVDTIAIDLDLHYFNSKPAFPGSLSDILKIALLPTKESPSPIFKYIVAGGVTLASFILTFLSFGRTAAKGVEALGRNPAASRIIHLGIILNIGICIAITVAGLTVSFLILRL